MQVLVLANVQAPRPWIVVLVPLSTLTAALLGSASVFVHMHVNEIVLSRN